RVVTAAVESCLPRASPEQRLGVLREAESAQEVLDAIVRDALADAADELARFVALIREEQALGRDGQDVRVCVGTARRLDCPIGGLVDLAEAHVRERAAREHRELQRIERAQLARGCGRCDRGAGIAYLTVDEAEGVMAEREVRAELDAVLERRE